MKSDRVTKHLEIQQYTIIIKGYIKEQLLTKNKRAIFHKKQLSKHRKHTSKHELSHFILVPLRKTKKSEKINLFL
jgi:hypothetical protein